LAKILPNNQYFFDCRLKTKTTLEYMQGLVAVLTLLTKALY